MKKVTQLNKISVSIALTFSVCFVLSGCGSRNNTPSSHHQQQNQQMLQSAHLIGYLERGTHTLHLLTSKGQPLPGFTPITDVQEFKIFDYVVAYKLLNNNEFHILNSQGLPLVGFKPVTGVKEFKISHQLIVFNLVHADELHILDMKGQPLPGFSPVPHVENFEISDHFIGFKLAPTQELHILNTQGQPLAGFSPIPHVSTFQISDQLVAYTLPNTVSSLHLLYDLYVLDSQGTVLTGFPKHRLESYKISNQLIAYTSTLDSTLRIHDAQGQLLPVQPQVKQPTPPTPPITDINPDTYQITNDLIGYIQYNTHDRLHILNSQGQPLNEFAVPDHIKNFYISKQLIGYIREVLPQPPDLYFFDTQGRPLSDIPTLRSVEGFTFNDRHITYKLQATPDDFNFFDISSLPFSTFTITGTENLMPIYWSPQQY